ncbi:hypothetical protein EW026_g6002 [Hermanssonia centrifuga]|uniref:Uncharacterized protein n=1 Tax=Hermanssonia centrifuga TaxID=98765 RepID=A0A4S4KCE4_9APHY|nr:hypothetical protein EW026_g6002 [Hermanssonia centrifuga]
MLAFIPLVTLAAAFGFASASPIAARQESARFGAITQFTVTYDSTKAQAQPQYLDVYIQGTLGGTFVQPEFLLKRTDYSSDSKTLTFQTTLPAMDTDADQGYSDAGSYLIWADITYPSAAGSLEVGGVSTPITVDLS